MTDRPRAALFMRSEQLAAGLFSADMRAELAELVELHPQVISDFDDPGAIAAAANVELAITGWSAPRFTPARLASMPALRAFVHAGGRAAWFIDRDPLDRDFAVSNAGEANALPVAQFSVAMVILSGKDAFRTSQRYAAAGDALARDSLLYTGGNYRTTVGVIGASRVGKLVIRMLRSFDFEVVVHDPYLSAAEAVQLGVRTLSLDALLEASDVVTLHVPDLPSTRGMLGRRELGMLRDGSTLINTARGVVVDQGDLIDELRTGRISACLDTTDPEFLPRGHELFGMENVFLTPHIAGSMGNELQRMGRSVIDEVRRYVAGEQFLFHEDVAGNPASSPAA